MPERTLDIFGLHAEDCECATCERGDRPTATQRRNAKLAFERRQVEKEERARAAQAPPAKPAAEGKARAAAYEDVDSILERWKPPVRPATPEELEEMKRAFPNLKGKT